MSEEFVLTDEDVDILLKAISLWEAEAMQTAVVGSLIGAMLSKDKDEARQRMEDEFAEVEAKSSARVEQAILLKAKLVHIRDQRSASEVAREFSGGKGEK